MNLKHLMSMKNSKLVVKALSYEGADDLLRCHICHLNNEITILQESYDEVSDILENGKISSGVRSAERELEEINLQLKEKFHQLHHTTALLADLESSFGMEDITDRESPDIEPDAGGKKIPLKRTLGFESASE